MCSMFTRLIEQGRIIVGRNFDFIQHGGALHFIPPTRSYGLPVPALFLIEQMGSDRPYEGVNASGLFIGVAAVNDSPKEMAKKPNMNDLGLIRFVLERAESTPEALELMAGFKLDYMQSRGYPPVHYLIVDKAGQAGIFEEGVYGEIFNLEKEKGIGLTNVSRAGEGSCWRREKIEESLEQGLIVDKTTSFSLLEMLQDATPTVYSCVYNLTDLTLNLCLESNFSQSHRFNLNQELQGGYRTCDFGELKLGKMNFAP